MVDLCVKISDFQVREWYYWLRDGIIFTRFIVAITRELYLLVIPPFDPSEILRLTTRPLESSIPEAPSRIESALSPPASIPSSYSLGLSHSLASPSESESQAESNRKRRRIDDSQPSSASEDKYDDEEDVSSVSSSSSSSSSPVRKYSFALAQVLQPGRWSESKLGNERILNLCQQISKKNQ